MQDEGWVMTRKEGESREKYKRQRSLSILSLALSGGLNQGQLDRSQSLLRGSHLVEVTIYHARCVRSICSMVCLKS